MEGTQLIKVRRQPFSEQIGTIELKEISNVSWRRKSGGIQQWTRYHFPYGIIRCTHILEGTVAHSGTHGPCPHDILVCVCKKDNKEIFDELLKVWNIGKRPAVEHNDVANKVREIVANKPGILATEVKIILTADGISKESIENAIRYLRRKEFKKASSLISEKSGTTQKLYIKE